MDKFGSIFSMKRYQCMLLIHFQAGDHSPRFKKYNARSLTDMSRWWNILDRAASEQPPKASRRMVQRGRHSSTSFSPPQSRDASTRPTRTSWRYTNTSSRSTRIVLTRRTILTTTTTSVVATTIVMMSELIGPLFCRSPSPHCLCEAQFQSVQLRQRAEQWGGTVVSLYIFFFQSWQITPRRTVK